MLLAAAALAVGAACGGSDDDEPAAGATTSTPAATTTETETEGIDPLEGASTEPVSAPAAGTETSLLERVDVGRHEGYDRVVFQFRNAVPGYRIAYVQPPLHEDGSGAEVEIDGTAFLLVAMEPASGFDLATGEGEMVYEGPRRLRGASVVREVVRTGDFEAQLAWAIGVDPRVDFRVTTLDEPARLVVDLRNH